VFAITRQGSAERQLLACSCVLIATWNLNNRAGKRRFRPEAARAIAALGADVVVLTEYYPRQYHNSFQESLSDFGWPYSLASESVDEVANRVLIVSRVALEPFHIALPEFDRQFPSNILAVTIPAARLRMLGLRIPAYNNREDRPLVLRSWDWLGTHFGRTQ
jgi:hypothetical protein